MPLSLPPHPSVDGMLPHAAFQTGTKGSSGNEEREKHTLFGEEEGGSKERGSTRRTMGEGKQEARSGSSGPPHRAPGSGPSIR